MKTIQEATGPEQWGYPVPILDEAERVKAVLMPLYTAGLAQSRLNMQEMVGDGAQIRTALDYPIAEAVDTSRVIDARASKNPLIDAHTVGLALPLSKNSMLTTLFHRQDLAAIHGQKDLRLSVALGECSVRDPEATKENTMRIKEWQRRFPLLRIMQRVYVEKPRTPVKANLPEPWKGFLYDPYLDDSNNINIGVIASRMLVCQITDYGVPVMKEQLSSLTAQYTDGMIAQDNSGARNARDQTIMEIMSASSATAGNKNPVEGDIEAAIQAVKSSRRPHVFIGTDHHGTVCVVEGRGNETAHVILRGGRLGKNYTPESVEEVKRYGKEYGVAVTVGIDVSHDNSTDPVTGAKDHTMQLEGIEAVTEQLKSGEVAITDVQMETNIVPGKQAFRLGDDPKDLEYAVSITDACLGPEDTEESLVHLHKAVAARIECTTGSRGMISLSKSMAASV